MEAIQSIGKVFNLEWMIEDPEEIYIYVYLTENCKVYEHIFIRDGERCLDFTILNVGLANDENDNTVLCAVARSDDIHTFLGMDVQIYKDGEDKSLLQGIIGSDAYKFYYLRRVK